MEEYELDETVIELEEHQYCDICGHKLDDGDEVYVTESGQVACNLVELVEDIIGHSINV